MLFMIHRLWVQTLDESHLGCVVFLSKLDFNKGIKLVHNLNVFLESYMVECSMESFMHKDSVCSND